MNLETNNSKGLFTNNNVNNDYNSNNVRNQIKNREPFAEGEGGYLYKENMESQKSI